MEKRFTRGQLVILIDEEFAYPYPFRVDNLDPVEISPGTVCIVLQDSDDILVDVLIGDLITDIHRENLKLL